ncbi:MbtH family protein [Streptomyces sp. HNM0574]|uniref:MbtH family protein n=1 Tax=Streptomyces sp. HNM0574 TaxID=2714954 RepID=UPI003217C38F
MTNPFESDESGYTVLRNGEGQYSLWPADLDVPDGWTVVKPNSSRSECLAHVEREWSDMRPAGLIAATDGADGTGAAH